jgi:hypothetical protein
MPAKGESNSSSKNNDPQRSAEAAGDNAWNKISIISEGSSDEKVLKNQHFFIFKIAKGVMVGCIKKCDVCH